VAALLLQVQLITLQLEVEGVAPMLLPISQ
jgi:hypothetical protein